MNRYLVLDKAIVFLSFVLMQAHVIALVRYRVTYVHEMRISKIVRFLTRLRVGVNVFAQLMLYSSQLPM